MRFKPRVVEAERAPVDSSGELQLPEDLDQLTQRLSREAQDLARRFPPDGDRAPARPAAGSKPSAARHGRLTRGIPWLSLAAAVVLLVAITGLIWQSASRDWNSQNQGETVSGEGPAAARQSPNDAPHGLDRTPSRLPSMTPAVWHDLSGPELEGVLDIHRDDDIQQRETIAL